MESIGTYLLSVSAAALLCGLADRFTGDRGGGAAARVVTGLFLTAVLLQPLGKFGQLRTLRLDVADEAQDAADEGQAQAQIQLAQLITQNCAAYILEKASELHADIQVWVEVSEDALPVPVGVRIQGEVAPYTKLQLQNYMEQQLGIAKENQQWT